MASADAESISQDNTSNKSNKNTELITFDNVPWPVRPSVGINYNFVVLMYTVGSIIAAFFYLLEKQVLDPLLVEQDISDNNNILQSNDNDIKDTEIEGDEGGDDINSWKEFARGMAGMYVIFVPFIPCLIWSFVVRYYWLKETNNNSITRGKKDN